MTQANHASVSQGRPALTVQEARVLTYLREHPGKSRSFLCNHLRGLRLKDAREALTGLLERGLIEMREVPEPGYETVAKRYWVVP